MFRLFLDISRHCAPVNLPIDDVKYLFESFPGGMRDMKNMSTSRDVTVTPGVLLF